MDKQVIHAVAGSGKTTLIINELNLEKRVAIITYTTANQNSLKDKVLAKFGFFPNNIHIFGFWQFAYRFCLVPFLHKKPNGIIYDDRIKQKNKYKYKGKGKKAELNYGVNGYVFNHMLCKLLSDKEYPYIGRIDEFFDELYVDEMQDFDSYDFEWLLSLSRSKIRIWLVGDFYQKTYSTSRAGSKGAKVRGSIVEFKKAIEAAGYNFDDERLTESRRCTPQVCEFIRCNTGIQISSSRNEDSSNISLIEDTTEILEILKDDLIKKLFFQKHYDYDCNSMNWGDSKGLDFDNICVVLNKTTFAHFKKNTLTELAPLTKSKFYVACTRSRGNVYFIEQNKIPDKLKK